MIPYKEDYLSTADQGDYVIIYSNFDSVSAISGGTVVNIFTLDSSSYMTIKNKNGSLFTTYGNFKSLAIRKNSKINVGDFLGRVWGGNSVPYNVVLAATTRKRIFTYYQLIDYLVEKGKKVKGVNK